jgi:hypothetical protein
MAASRVSIDAAALLNEGELLVMKRAALASLFLLAMAATSLFAAPAKLVDDVIRMSKKGISDDVIIALIDAAEDRTGATADDVIAMSEAGVSKAVIQAMIAPPAEAAQEAVSETRANEPATEEQPAPAPEEEQADANGPPDEPGCVTFEPPIADSTFDPPYPAWLWNPYWYMPQLDTRTDRGPSVARSGEAPVVRDTETERGPTVARTGGAPPVLPDVRRNDAPPPRPETSRRSETPAHETTTRKPDSGDRGRDVGRSSQQSGGRSQGGGLRHR